MSTYLDHYDYDKKRPPGVNLFDEALEHMGNNMSLRNNACVVRKNYLRCLQDLLLYLQKRSEDCLADEIKSFLVYSRDKQGLSYS